MVLRVIAGDFRRRLLKTPTGESTRPYTDRARTMVFDRLRGEIEGARVADVFSGVGTMGLESMSRGAASCVFFEGDPETFTFLRNNAITIAQDCRFICWKADVRRTSFRPKAGEDCLPYSLIFFDPPYAMVPQLLPGKPLAASLKRLARPDISDPNATLILRTPDRTDIESIGPWTVEERWDVSSMIIWRMKKVTPSEFTDVQTDEIETDEAIDTDGALDTGGVLAGDEVLEPEVGAELSGTFETAGTSIQHEQMRGEGIVRRPVIVGEIESSYQTGEFD